MLHDLEPFAERCNRQFSVDDLTMVVAVRAHGNNPWVFPRLAMLTEHYDPLPRILISDFGTAEPYATELRNLCGQHEYEYLRIEDDGVFSLAIARNRGAEAAQTPLLFFCDVDCVGSRDLFHRLVEQANLLEIGQYFDQIIDLPVYHLTEEQSDAALGLEDPQERATAISRDMARGVYGGTQQSHSFVAAYSNIFLMHRSFFELTGGYDESFRGHGSEDFEYLLRVARYSRQFPMPAEPTRDEYGPQRPSYFEAKTYTGFRRLFEVMALQAETAGLRIAHLHHPRPDSDDGWYSGNDWKRKRFLELVLPLENEPARLLTRDWLSRQRTVLVLLRHMDQFGLFLPLRLAGYRIDALFIKDRANHDEIIARIERGAYDAVAIFNPYMKSHVELRMYFEFAKKHGATPIVIERGALPESFYYASDVSYCDPDFSQKTIEEASISKQDAVLADVYQARLRTGGSTLEQQGDFGDTMSRYRILSKYHQQTCLVPLQLEDDMAVTCFTDGYVSYQEFLTELKVAVEQNPETLFFIKRHPLSKIPIDFDGDNVVLCTPEDNIHALIELVKGVVLYNSGVGLLSLIHRRNLVSVGNAFYNLPGMGARAGSVQAALEIVFTDVAKPDNEFVTRFVAWLLTQKYSFFKADSLIREFDQRRSHAYKHLDFYAFNFGTHHISYRRSSRGLGVQARSYAAARLGIGVKEVKTAKEQKKAKEVTKGNEVKKAKEPKLVAKTPGNGIAATASRRLHTVEPSRGNNVGRKLRKLARDPERFFGDSQSQVVRWIGRTVLNEGRSSK